MGSRSDVFSTIFLDDTTWAVVQTDPGRPRILEIVATFYDEKRARDYAGWQNGQADDLHALAERTEPSHAPFSAPQKNHRSVPEAQELSPRQSAVLQALHDNLDESRQVAMRAAALAGAAKIPLGSLHSVLGSLEKKGLIELKRAGSARSPAVYKVL